MNLSRGQRATVSRAQAVRLQLSVSRLPTTIRNSLVRSHPSNFSTARSMWWWSRRHDSSMDEDMEERFSRHQKLMRNRYSKLLRRSTIWEGSEHIQSPVWARSRRWLVTRWADKKALSYQRALKAGVQDPARRTDSERPWKEWDRDFDKLKSRIDEEIDRDPYGALFGRHLRGPPSPNNSSWTSFSWIYGPLKSMKKDISNTSPDGTPDLATTSVAALKSEERKTFSIPQRAPTTRSSQTSFIEQEYEFDPISMRKVPKQKEASPRHVQLTAAVASQPATKPAFLETLFSEHGVDIPVKTYKPHKVYRHGGFEATTARPKVEASKTKTSGIDVENSRLRDLQALKFKTLGNSIDTTAEYGGKYKNPTDPEPIHISSTKIEPGLQESGGVPQRHDVKGISGEDTSALFAGTTYGTKAKTIAATTMPKPSFKTSWLEKEGFQTLRQALSDFEIRARKPEISMQVKAPVQSTKVEPALDRVRATDVKLKGKQETIVRRAPSSLNDEAEDLDLLRASDVRAATKHARSIKQEMEEDKQKARRNLEPRYPEHQLMGAAKFAMNAESTKDNLSRRLNSVWAHVKQYPQGIVAKTVNGMGIFDNSNYKLYERLQKPAQDSTEKIVFKDETLSKTSSIYKTVGKRSAKPLHTFTPSQEVIDIERAEKARIAFARKVNEESKHRSFTESKQAGALALDIRNAYEEQYGKIDINHRQAAANPSDSASVIPTTPPRKTGHTELKKPAFTLQPMGPATVKPGVKENPVIYQHINVFEPKLSKIVDDAKSVRKVIHDAKLEIMAMRSRRPQTVWSGRSSDALSIGTPIPEPLRIESALDRATTEKQPSATTNKPVETVSTPKYISQYIILAYDPSSNAVTTSPLDSSMSSAQESVPKTGVPQILANLNHTAKFLSHLASLSNDGYEVVSGGGDVLLFQKRSTKVADPPMSPLLAHVKAIIDKNKLAAQEASAQPVARVAPVKTIARPVNSAVKEAATLLDEIPASEPRPGPAGPTAPPRGPTSYVRPKVRRQEEVFSASKASRVSQPPAASPTQKAWEDVAQETPGIQDRLWTRFKRGVKRVTLTAAVMGAGAYTIGAVAESLGAQHHPEKAIRAGRMGIYSTEKSR